MLPQNRHHLLLAGLLLACWAVLFNGCSRAARYEVLTFFFTGVPPLDGPPPEAEIDKRARPADLDLAGKTRREQLLAERDRIAAMKPYTGHYAHGPYAAQACEQCHEMAAGGFGFGNVASQTKKNIIPGRFVRTPEQLCVSCHSGKSRATVQAAGLHLHGPAWNCLTCHQPHNGKEPFFLKVEAGKLCSQCHGPGYIHDAGLHTGLEECLECHNPHIGRDSRMLREEFAENF